MTELITGAAASDTHQKALRINLDPRWYGTIAEIGAGQEVGAAAPAQRVGGIGPTASASAATAAGAAAEAVAAEAGDDHGVAVDLHERRAVQGALLTARQPKPWADVALRALHPDELPRLAGAAG